MRDVGGGDVEADHVDLDAEDGDGADAEAQEVVFGVALSDCCGQGRGAA